MQREKCERSAVSANERGEREWRKLVDSTRPCLARLQLSSVKAARSAFLDILITRKRKSESNL